MFALIMPSAFVRSNKAKCIHPQAPPPGYIESFSLRLGHLRGLTVHRTVIQYPQAASLLAAARSRSGSDSPPDCHSIPSRRFATH